MTSSRSFKSDGSGIANLSGCLLSTFIDQLALFLCGFLDSRFGDRGILKGFLDGIFPFIQGGKMASRLFCGEKSKR